METKKIKKIIEVSKLGSIVSDFVDIGLDYIIIDDDFVDRTSQKSHNL